MRRSRIIRLAVRTLVPLALLLSLPAAAAFAQESPVGTPANGELYFTTFQNQGTCSGSGCTTDVWKVSYNYDGNQTFTLGSPTAVATTPGADGIVFAPGTTNLLVGGQSTGNVFEVNPANGAYTSVASGLSADYHLSIGPAGQHVYTAGLPGPLASVPINPLAAGTKLDVTGDNTSITELAFVPGMPGVAFYTSSTPAGNGDFGELDLKTMVTTQLMSNLPAAHGIIYDPYTGDLILTGANEIAQINPADPTELVSKLFVDTSGTQFDQAAVDGIGHLFVASNNNGDMLFLDYSQSRLVGSPGYMANRFLANSLDDLVNQMPEVPFAAALPLLGLPAWYMVRRRRQRLAAA